MTSFLPNFLRRKPSFKAEPYESIIKIKLHKNNGKLRFQFKIHPLLEEYFYSYETNTSTRWRSSSGRPLKFYNAARDLSVPANNERYFTDNFGGVVMTNTYGERPRINIALLRTVGASKDKGVSITLEKTCYSEYKHLAKGLSEAAKYIFLKKVLKTDLASEINIEI